MFIFTLVQSRTHVDTVQTVLHGVTNSRHICWSYIMKVLGSHVTYVRRNSPRVLSLTVIYFVMELWSRIFAVNVQSVSIQQVNWNIISWNTQTSRHFIVVGAVKSTNVKETLYSTLISVLVHCHSVMSNQPTACVTYRYRLQLLYSWNSFSVVRISQVSLMC